MLLTAAFDTSIAVILIIISYFLGSIPFGIIFGKIFSKKDIRNYGSHNIGSTNAVRVLGKKIGFVAFFFEVLKGMFIIFIITLLEKLGIWFSPISIFNYGLAAIVGHCYSIFLEFTGGKAVATSLGVILLLTPMCGIACIIIFILVILKTGYVSLGSTAATITVVICVWILYFFGIENPTNIFEYFISSRGLTTCIQYTLLGILIISKHKANYQRLLAGTENSFKKSK